jgi:chemotaxis protein histidine kinase CheA
VYRLAHGLAGSAATFGFPQISHAAQRVERLLLLGLENDGLEPNAGEIRVAKLLLALESASMETKTHRDALDPSPPDPEAEDGRRVFIFDDDADRAAALATEIALYGYRVRVFANTEKAT